MPMSRTLFGFLLICLVACQPSEHPRLSDYAMGTLTLPTGYSFYVYIAATDLQRKKGLSGITKDSFPSDRGMLFIYQEMALRHFWMPETHFDLDIVFMKSDFEIIDIQRQLKHFPYSASEGEVPRSKPVSSQFVLEVKSGSILANQLHIGEKLVFDANNNPDL